ncbi:MAG: tetratricopeptide repeat protein [Rhizobiales bacterium]|nr:tetratricopeptide repeat protein [Hyphomicrobiales bacterium]
MSDESLFREVDEEVRQEQFKKLWDRYGNAVVALCLVVVAGVAGFKGWQYWQVNQSETAALTFFEAAKLAEAGKPGDALKQFETVSHPGYGLLAKFRQAGVLAADGKTEEAVKLYDAIAARPGANAALRDLARIRAGYVLSETLKPDELTARVGGFDQAGNPWRHAAREIIGIAAWRAGDHKLAQTTMAAILSDAETPAALRQRAQTISQLLTPLMSKP